MHDLSRRAAYASFAAAAAYILIAVTQHAIRPDLDPSWRMLSEYALGDYGWLETLGLLLLTSSCVALVIALRANIRGIAGTIGLGLVLLSGLGLLIMSAFATDPATITPAELTTHGMIHQLGAQLDQLPIADLLIAWSLWKNSRWSSSRGLVAAATAVVWLGQLVFVAALVLLLPQHDGVPGPDVPLAWAQRFMIATQCTWLMSLAWQVRHLREQRAE